MRIARLLLSVLGLTAMGYAISGMVSDDGVRLAGVLPFLAGLVIAHDLILMPIAIGIGALLVRYLPGWIRPFVAAGLLVSAAVTVFALPFVIGAGQTADNPSRFPRPYGLGLAITLSVVWLVVAGLARRARAHKSTVDDS